jgi:RNA polymerase sigma factor FliA
MDPAEADTLFREYRRTRDVRTRNKLVEAYRPLARAAAMRRASKTPPCLMDADDFETSAVMGLMEAVENFDPDRGIQFSTFASRRIVGHMLDDLRESDWVPRLERTRSKRSGEAPPKVGTLATVVFENHNGRRDFAVSDLVADEALTPEESAIERDSFDGMLRGLSRAERAICTLYYRDDLTMFQVGQAIGMSESRVSQLLSNILKRMRAAPHCRERDAVRSGRRVPERCSRAEALAGLAAA